MEMLAMIAMKQSEGRLLTLLDEVVRVAVKVHMVGLRIPFVRDL